MPQQDEHEFMVAGVELAAAQTPNGIAITLTDARGGKVRLNLSTDMAEQLREKVSAALDKVQDHAGRRISTHVPLKEGT